MGNSVDQGIVSGAHWIKSNFYDNGYKTLDSMKKAGYASDQTWDTSISKIANDAIQIL
jgi:beta-N-acetylglucosaminidase